MKKQIAFITVLCLIIALCSACGEAEPTTSASAEITIDTIATEPATVETTIPETTEPQNTKTLQLGSMKFDIPNDVEITNENDLLYVFALVPSETYLSVHATDAAEFGSDGLDLFILLQHQTWMEDGEHYNEDSTSLSVGTYDVDFDLYNIDTDNGTKLHNMVGTFTDGSYVYTFYYSSGNQNSAGKDMFFDLLETVEFETKSTDVAAAEKQSSLSDNATMGEKNALREAKDYLAFSAFSYDGLIDQLEYEGYSHDEAVYAVDNCGADWFEQAEKCAESYLEYSAFSKSELIGQLEYEGFTYEQAVHGVEANGY